MDAIRLHPDHGNHALRCVTYGCCHAFQPLSEANAAQRLACLSLHAVRCTDCHTWADLPARPRAAERSRSQLPAFELDQDGTEDPGEQLSLF